MGKSTPLQVVISDQATKLLVLTIVQQEQEVILLNRVVLKHHFIIPNPLLRLHDKYIIADETLS